MSSISNSGHYGGVASSLMSLSKIIDITGNDPVANQVLVANGNGRATWTTLVDQVGVISLNGSSNSIQSFTTDTGGTDFSITTNTGTGLHTFNMPDAGPSSRGLINASTQTIAGAKTFSGGIISTSLITPSNQDLTIDAQGTGKVRINTIQSTGIIFGVDSTEYVTEQIRISPDGDTTKPSLCLGVVRVGTNYNTVISSQSSGGWGTIWFNDVQGSSIFGGDLSKPPSFYNVATYKNTFNGNSNFINGSLYVAGNLLCDSSRNITCNSINGVSPAGYIWAEINSGGSITSSYSPIYLSCSKISTGIYEIQVGGGSNTPRAPQVTIVGASQYNFASVYDSGIVYILRVELRSQAGVLLDCAFNFSTYYN